MPDILHDILLDAPIGRVFDAFATPQGLDAWWTLRAAGAPCVGATYDFFFGESYDWRGVVSRCEPGRLIEWEFNRSDADWNGAPRSARIRPRLSRASALRVWWNRVHVWRVEVVTWRDRKSSRACRSNR
jgi:hypothetical protein